MTDMTETKAEDWTPVAKVFWSVVGGVLCVLWGSATLVRVVPREGMGYDFAQEWTSTRNYFAGRPIYLQLSQSMPLYLGETWRAVHIDVNAHPPGSVFLLLPFGLLDYRAAQGLWNSLSLVALAVSLWLILRRRGLGMSPWYVLPIGALLLTSNSLAAQVFQGQFNLVLLLLITGAWVADRGGREVWAGTLIGVAAAMKLFPAFLGLYFLARRRWAAVAAVILGFAWINGLGLATLGWDAYRTYFADIVPRVNDSFRDFWANASVWGYWSKLLEAPNRHVLPLWESPWAAKAAGLLSAVAVTTVAGWRCVCARGQQERDLAFGVCVIAMILVAPVAWDHYFLMLVLPLACLWCHGPPTLRFRGLLFALMIILLTLRPALIWVGVVGGPGELPLDPNVAASVGQPIHALTVLAYQTYALLGLFLVAFRAGRPAGPAEKQDTVGAPA